MTVGAILTGAALAGVGSQVQNGVNTRYNDLNTGLKGVIKGIHSQWAKGAGRTIVTASQNLRVEPMVLMDERVARLSYASSTVEAAQRLFSSYYLLAVAAENTIGSVSIQKRLGKFNPDKDLISATADFLSVESYEFGLPFVGEVDGLDRYKQYSTESSAPHYSTESDKAGGGKDLYKQATDISNLSIGQIVGVKIVDGNNAATIPVMIRMRVLGASPTNMVDILGIGATDTSRSARLRDYRVGLIGLKDLLTNQDIIDRYHRASFADKTGYFRKAHAQHRKGLLSTLLNGEPSLGDITSIAIMSRQTVDEFEREHYIRLDDYQSRQRVFDKSLLMMMMVVDDDNGTVTVHTRDIEMSQRYWLKDIEKTSKSGNDDLTDLLKSFLAGQIPGRL